MNRCNNEDCKAFFSEPEIITLETGVHKDGYYETYDIEVCPYCGCDDFETAYKCMICDEYEVEMKTDDWCKGCYKDMESVLTIALENFHKQHPDATWTHIYDLATEVMEDWEYEKG